MVILGIETSCDETAIAVIDVGGQSSKPHLRVLSNVVASQVKLHAKFGGVVPHLAKREHQQNLVSVLLMALRQAGYPVSKISGNRYDRNYIRVAGFSRLVKILEREPELFERVRDHVLPLKEPKIDAIAVTVGPGLAPALWVGVNFALALAFLWKKSIIPVNHLEGHIYTNMLSARWRISHAQFLISRFNFPALCLIVSGGHTELVLMAGFGKYRILGETLDDAAGEAFDKVAKMMHLGFPGGPIISRLAEQGDASAFPFPRPMLRTKNFDFSFSGLKTAVLYTLKDLKRVDDRIKRDIAASFEQAVVDVLVIKTIQAARQYRVKTVMIGGGVAANKKLRHDLGQAIKQLSPRLHYLTPDTALTGDNALMIALAGWFNRHKKRARGSVRARANLRLDDSLISAIGQPPASRP